MFEIGENATDRVSRRRYVEATVQPNSRVPKLPLKQANVVDVPVVAVARTTLIFDVLLVYRTLIQHLDIGSFCPKYIKKVLES
jgi:hypothetical protein